MNSKVIGVLIVGFFFLSEIALNLLKVQGEARLKINVFASAHRSFLKECAFYCKCKHL